MLLNFLRFLMAVMCHVTHLINEIRSDQFECKWYTLLNHFDEKKSIFSVENKELH